MQNFVTFFFLFARDASKETRSATKPSRKPTGGLSSTVSEAFQQAAEAQAAARYARSIRPDPLRLPALNRKCKGTTIRGPDWRPGLRSE